MLLPLFAMRGELFPDQAEEICPSDVGAYNAH